MSCLYPLKGFRDAGGKLRRTWRPGVIEPISVACGQCLGCRLDRSKDWALRCMHEARFEAFENGRESAFVTLTYRDEALPVSESLDHDDFKQFMKLLRHRIGHRFSYYMCGEYGGENRRPHYHALLFGVDFQDGEHWRTRNGHKYYRSPTLEKAWKLGFSDYSDVTWANAAYVARYILKKVNGDQADEHYEHVTRYGEVVRLKPEYTRMSLRPAIGKRWFEKYYEDCFPSDNIHLDGRRFRVPRYYDNLYRDMDPEAFAEIQERRRLNAERYSETLERIGVTAEARQECLEKKVGLLKRDLGDDNERIEELRDF